MSPSPSAPPAKTALLQERQRRQDVVDEIISPDFCNFGLVLRTLLLVPLGCALFALPFSASLFGWLGLFLNMTGIAVPTALFWIVMMCSLGQKGARQGRWILYGGAALAAVLPTALLLLCIFFLRPFETSLTLIQIGTISLFCGFCGALAFHYFDLRLRAFSPALASAKLQALQSRIRPHFLFNSLNTAAALVRSDPAQAEHLLEDVSDVFRAALRSAAVLVPLGEEIQLAKQYVAIEQLRLGDRLRIRWHIAPYPESARVPSLLLQPLLENAVHHGIEPAEEPGNISVKIGTFGRELRIKIENSYTPGVAQGGSGIALSNIRERLALLYDLEAQMHVHEDGRHFRVFIKLPTRPGSKK